jgi:hypothetical protein
MTFSECWSHGGKTAAALLLSLAMVNLFSSEAAGQQVAVSEVDGRVTDPSGQAIAGATVKMTEVDKQVAHTATTDSAGRYRLPNLPAGEYQLVASAPGFKNYVQSGITLQVGNNIEILIPMQVGSVSENIEVRADAAMVETKDNAIAQVIDQQRMVDLPLNGRNPTQLLTLTGASATAPAGDLTGSKNIQGSNGSQTFTVAGGQANGISYLLDGGDNNDAFSNVNLPLPFPDAIQEYSVQTSATGAQLGLHPGGVVNIVTKSGSNSFHGDVFEFLRNYSLNARQSATLARDSLKRSQFGGVAGGRIIKDKLFFFGGYQGTRQRSNPAATQAHVPTAAALNGDFSVLDAPKSAGGCQNSAVTLKDPTTGAPFPGNRIPASYFDPAAQKLLKNYIPVSSDPCGLVLFGQPANNPDDQWIGRIDYVRSTKQSIYARYYLYDYTAQTFFDGKNALTTGPNPGNQDRSQTMTIGDIYSVSPSMVNAFHATFDRRRDNRGSASNLFSPTDLGVNMFVNVPNYTQITVSNYFNVGCGTCALAYFDVNTFQLSDDYSIIKGRHQIGFGFDGRKLQFNSLNNQQANGQITFNGNTTGDALADLMIGRMSQFVDGNALSDYIRQTVFAFYAQDTFRATPHLTINLGFRWEPSLPAYDKYGRGNQFNAALFAAGYHSTKYPNAPAGLLFDTDAPNTHGKAFTASHWLGASPRVGLVWDPAGDGRQTIRVGAALIHDTTELFYPERWTTNPPYASSVTLTNPTAPFSNPWLGYPGGDPFPGAGIFPVGGTYVSIPPNVKPTYMAQWNLSYQRQVANNWLVTLSYLGNKTTHVLGSYDVNPSVYIPGSTASTNNRRLLYLANPAQGQYYSNIEQTDDGGISHYNGLLVSVNHRMSHGFTVLSNYTWSHCVSDVDFTGELAGTIYQNPYSRSAERASCGFDHRQIFNTSLVAISGGLGTGLAKQVTRQWEVAPIINIQSGAPFTPTDGGKDISLSGQLQDRPNVVLPGNVYEHTQAAWFNQAAFQVQPTGTFGNAGRFSLVAPGSINWDMAVSRNFPFKERYKVTFRADFFNIMNHPNWNAPTASISSGQFGQITTFSSPRIIQMAMKFYF